LEELALDGATASSKLNQGRSDRLPVLPRSLAAVPELRPGTDNLLESHLDELLGQLSSGPTLDPCDMLMLAWLMLKVRMLAPETENRPYDAYDSAYDSACVLRGTFYQVVHFLLVALDHRVQ
jgi:hypothetical protein